MEQLVPSLLTRSHIIFKSVTSPFKQACGCVHKSIPNLPTSCNGIFNGKSFQKLIEFEEAAT
jgi:hypothetical protein